MGLRARNKTAQLRSPDFFYSLDQDIRTGRYAEPLIGLDLIGLDLIVSVLIGLDLIGLVLIG